MKVHTKKKTGILSNWISPKRFVIGILFLSVILSLFFAVFKINESPPCINADEAAFGYNAYSLLKTGADEYGNTLPVRLKSFGDYKMPLYSYLSIPFIGTFGLTDESVRSLNILLAILFPFAIFYLAKEVFGKDEIGAISALLISVSMGKGVVERHAHEALLASFLITLTTLFFIKFLRSEQMKFAFLSSGTLLLALFSYQSSRVYALLFLLFAIGYFFYKKQFKKTRIFFLAIIIAAIGLFAMTDIIYKPARVENLLLINSSGFAQKVLELRNEGGHLLMYNKITIGLRDIVSQEMAYFSPQFLAADGDKNLRFGFPGMAPMTPLVYVFIFIGFYYIFKNRERWRFFLLLLIIISPLSAALSWAEMSITRTMFLLIPLILVSSYGIYQILNAAAKKKILWYVLSLLIFLEALFLFYTWDFYFNHYPKRAIIARSWQCGYKELGDYVKANYNKYNTFYITQKNGEPYIFMLFYLKYPPEKYQKEASLSEPDEFGFGQVAKFDKFNFSFPADAIRQKNVVLIGYPDDFNQLRDIDTGKIKKIIINSEEIFWIYET